VIEGIKIVFFRVVYGLFVMLIFPIYNYIYAYAIKYTTDSGLSYCVSSLPIINQDVQSIKWIVFIGIAAAGYHLFYRAVMLRAYESQYSQTYGSGPYGGR